MWRVLGLCSDPAVTDVASFTTELSEPLLHLGEVDVGSTLDPKERTQVKPRCASQRLVRFVPPGGAVPQRGRPARTVASARRLARPCGCRHGPPPARADAAQRPKPAAKRGSAAQVIRTTRLAYMLPEGHAGCSAKLGRARRPSALSRAELRTPTACAGRGYLSGPSASGGALGASHHALHADPAQGMASRSW